MIYGTMNLAATLTPTGHVQAAFSSPSNAPWMYQIGPDAKTMGSNKKRVPQNPSEGQGRPIRSSTQTQIAD